MSFSDLSTRSKVFGVIAAVAMTLPLAACGPAHSSATAGSAKVSAKAVVSAPANVAAENAVKAEVSKCINASPVTTLVSKSGRNALKTCLSSLVPPAKRTTFGTCAVNAMMADKVWKQSGRQKFENSDAAVCVNQVTSVTKVAPAAKATKPAKSTTATKKK